MNSSPDISIPENPSRTDIGTRGSERFWKHSLLLGFLFAATHFLPQVAPHQSLKDKTDNQTAIVYDSGKYIPASVRMGQNYLEASPQPHTITREVNEQIIQFQENEKDAIKRTELKRNLIQSVVADPRLGIPKKEQPLWVNRMLGITFIESKGYPQAFSGTAYGLAQLTPETAKEVAQKYKIPKYDLNNEWDSLFMGTAYQQYLVGIYGFDFSIPAYNWGLGRLNIAKRSYPNQKYMTPEELLRNSAVLKNLEKNNIPTASTEEAKSYITRFKAALEIFSAKQVIPPQTKA